MSNALTEGVSLAASPSTTWERIQPWAVVFFASLFFFFEFMQINMFNALDPYLFKAYHLTDNTQLGTLSANYMYANVIFLFPAGIILDRVSTRWVIIFAMTACVTCTLLFSFTNQLWQGELCRFVTGIGGAFCLLSCVRLASRWFPPKKMALVVGLIVTLAMTGALVAQTPFTILAKDFGWRNTLLFDAIAGYLMLVFIIFFVRDCPRGKSTLSEQHHVLSDLGVLRTILRSLKNFQNWLAGIYASLINIPVFILGNWGIMYLNQVHHINRKDASFITTMMYLGLIVGCPIFGWISDRLQRRRLPMIMGAVACLLVILPLILVPSLNFTDLLLLFFLIGLTISSQIISYAIVAESNPSALTGASEGVASVLIMSGGFLIPMFAGLLDLNWHHHFVNGFPVYSTHAFNVAFLIMPIAFVIALGAAIAIKETYCKSFSQRKSNAA